MKHFLALALMTLGIMAQAQERVLVSESTDGKQHYLYPSTIKKSTYGLMVWIEVIFIKPQLNTFTNKYFIRSKVQNLIDCDGMRSAIMGGVSYSKKGNVVYSSNISEYDAYSDLTPVAPGSVGWTIAEETCRRYNQGY